MIVVVQLFWWDIFGQVCLQIVGAVPDIVIVQFHVVALVSEYQCVVLLMKCHLRGWKFISSSYITCFHFSNINIILLCYLVDELRVINVVLKDQIRR